MNFTELTAKELLILELRDRLAKCEAENNYLRERVELLESCATLLREARELLVSSAKRLERLKHSEALNEYANHPATCSHWNADIPGDTVCDCGYDAARAALEE